MRQYCQVWVDRKFVDTIRRNYKFKSLVQATRELNSLLEKIEFKAELNDARKKR